MTATFTAHCIPTTHDTLWNPGVDRYTQPAADMVNFLDEIKEEGYAFILIEYNNQITLGYALDGDCEGWGTEYETMGEKSIAFWKQFV
jgi:hypothetical protein